MVVITTGENWPDALAGGPFPIIPVRRDSVPTAAVSNASKACIQSLLP